MQKKLSMRAASALFTALSIAALAQGCAATPADEAGEDTTNDGDALNGVVCLGSQAGAYCGSDMMSGADASTLYQCPGPNKAPTSAKACANGCVVAPPGKPDVCAAGPLCLGSAAGAYCGNDEMSGADASTLYQCPGANKAPASSQVCANGCNVAPPGTPDSCKAGGGGGGGNGTYKLPWHAGVPMNLTQDCNDSCCADHVGNDKYAWDFADAKFFDVVAPRGGTVTHLKMNSTNGCGSVSCENQANFIVIDHGDGTQSTFLHLKGFSLDPAVTCGAVVQQGQRLATVGSTGWSSGTHLHYQVSKVHPGAPTCECGSDGMGCSPNTVPWADFWPNATYPTLPVSFLEWPAASSCANRRIALPASHN